MPAQKIHFTKAVLKGLPVSSDGRSVEYSDDISRGLRLRVTPGGIKSFYLLRKFQGRTERVHIGRFPETTIAQAKKEAAKIHSSMDAGINPNDRKRDKRLELTVADLFSIYKERHVLQHTKRPKDVEWHYETYIKKPLGTLKLFEVTKGRVSSWHTNIGGRNGKSTANRAHTLLRAMFNRAKDWDLWKGDNPTAGIKRFRETPRERLVTQDELKRLFDALRLEVDGTLRNFFLIMILTGARRGNVLSMEWKDINLESGLWAIPETKNGEGLLVPLVGQALAILSTRREVAVGSYVFPGTGKEGHLVEPKKAWARALNNSGIEDLRMHDLRHAFGSYLASTGANQFIIRDAMGHKDIATTSRYVQMGHEVIRHSMAAAADMLTKDAGDLIPTAEIIEFPKEGVK